MVYLWDKYGTIDIGKGLTIHQALDASGATVAIASANP